MLIVDSQVHIWESGTPVSIHRQVSHYTKDELLRDMDEAGVDRVILHPPSWDPRANEVAIERPGSIRTGSACSASST